MSSDTGRHELHDPELVARFAAGDATAAEVDQVQRWAETCPECAVLASDLRSIMDATQEMRTLAGAGAPAAPRDFRLTPDDAARLRRRGPWQIFGTPRTAGALRGLGGALATLGLVGLLVSAGLPGLLGRVGGSAASGSAEAPDATAFGAFAPVAPTATADTRLEIMATAGPQADTSAGPAGGAESGAGGGSEDASTRGSNSSQATATLGSLTALVLGLALLLASRRGSRQGT